MDPKIFLRLSKLNDFFNMLNSLKAIQTSKLLLIIKQEGTFLLSTSTARNIIGEAFMRNLEFDVYRILNETEITVDFQVFRNVLKSICKSSNSPTLTIEYPYKDQKLLLTSADDNYDSHFYIDTFACEPQQTLELSNVVIAEIKFHDAKIIKQAMEVACHCKSDMEIFLTFSTLKPMLYFTKDDPITDIKSKITIPYVELVDTKVTKNCERTYPAKVLKNIANFPKCKQVEVKMHQEGVLEIEVAVSSDAWVRHFINPCEN